MSIEREEELLRRIDGLEGRIAEQDNRIRHMEEYLALWSRQGQSPLAGSPSAGKPPEQQIPQQPLMMPKPAAADPAGLQQSLKQQSNAVSSFFKQEHAAGTLLNRIGIVALLLALVFFLKYAFDNDWIGDLGRVAIGLLFGLSLLGGGEYFRSKGYSRFAFGLTGGGLGALYASFYAAYDFYSLIDVFPAFGLMILVTATGVTLALRHNSPAIAAMGVLGGFLTPFLLQTPNPNAIGLFSYVMVLNLTVLGVSLRRRWRGVHLLGFFLTALTTWAWYEGRGEDWKIVLTAASLYFVLYVAVTIFYSLQREKAGRKTDMVLLLSNPTYYFLMVWLILDNQGYWDLYGGFIAVAMAAVYLIIGTQVFQRVKEDPVMAQLIMAVAAGFLTLAIPIQFEQETVTLLWCVEAAVLWYGALRLKDTQVLRGAGAIGALALGHLIFIDSDVSVWNLDHYWILLNSRSLSYGGFIAALLLAVWLYRRGDWNPWGKGERLIKVLQGLAAFLVILLLTLEVTTYGEFQASLIQKQIDAIYQQYEPPLWSDEEHDVYYDKMAVYDSEINAKIRPFEQEVERWRDFQSLSVSGVWGISALTFIIVGLRRGRKGLRTVGLALLGVVLLKLFFFDLSQMNILFRIIAFGGVGALTLLASFLYQRQQKEAEGK